MIDLNASELNRLYEGSKDDHYIVVGSEIRQMIGMIRRRDERIAGLEAQHGSAQTALDPDSLTAVVRKVLDQGVWPEYRMEDDRGLEVDEYVIFIQEVLAAVSPASSTNHSPPETK